MSIVAIPQVYVKVNKGINIGSRGSVKAIGIGVYGDSACTNAVTFLDWSVLDIGSSYVRTIYIKNTGNVVAVLALDTVDWDPPSASDFISLTWDYDGQPFEPNTVVKVILTLTLDPTLTGITDFSFNIIIANVG